jgi:hypothetical protein
LAHPALRPLLAGVSPDMHHASGVSVGDDDAERAGGIVHAEDTLVDSRVDEPIIVVPGHFHSRKIDLVKAWICWNIMSSKSILIGYSKS